MKTLSYDEVKELEEMVKLTTEAERLVSRFKNIFVLNVKDYIAERRIFKVWSDSHNSTYLKILDNGNFKFEYRFLHESYDVEVEAGSIFDQLKNNYRGLDHFKSSLCEIERELDKKRDAK